MEESEMESLTCSITPEKVERLVREIEANQPKVNRGSVAIGKIVDRLLAGKSLTVEERSALEPRLIQAIMHAIEQSPILGFADGG